MVDYTKITVSKNGKYLFATEQGHLTYPLEAKVIYKLLKEKFPESEGYKVDVMMWESRGYFAIKDERKYPDNLMIFVPDVAEYVFASGGLSKFDYEA